METGSLQNTYDPETADALDPETTQRAKTVTTTNCDDLWTETIPDGAEAITCSIKQVQNDRFCNAERCALLQHESVLRLPLYRGQQNLRLLSRRSGNLNPVWCNVSAAVACF